MTALVREVLAQERDGIALRSGATRSVLSKFFSLHSALVRRARGRAVRKWCHRNSVQTEHESCAICAEVGDAVADGMWRTCGARHAACGARRAEC